MQEISFSDLGLDEKTLKAVEKKGFVTPSPIQILAIPRLLSSDSNMIVKARTGTGKTAAFALPIIQTINQNRAKSEKNAKNKENFVRALILEPTRELAVQTFEEIKSFSQENFPKSVVLYGGVNYSPQIRELKNGVQIVVGTPGRIQDHIERETLKVDKIDFFILDEGDEMLDMGFFDDIEKIFSNINSNARILLFSATMPQEILKVAQKFLGDYEICEEEGFFEEALLIDQKYWIVRSEDKIEALVRLIDFSDDFYGLVFTQTKIDADLVAKLLDERGYEAVALHGDVPQSQREKILERFRRKKTRILVATDVAARGIDIADLTHVVNYTLPFDASTYIHRIGRTGRAGKTGNAITFVRPQERRRLLYLKNAVKKSAKGEMILEEIPKIDDVLNAKRQRMFFQLKERIKIFEENSLQENSKDDFSANRKKNETEENFFTQMAEELCEKRAAENVLAQILSLTFGKSLDKNHYGVIKSFQDQKFEQKMPAKNQIRIFCSLGKNGGYSPKKIATFFSKLLHIPQHAVDQIDVAESFCLVSLPREDAKHALFLAKQNPRLPRMHIDVKSHDSEKILGFNEKQKSQKNRKKNFHADFKTNFKKSTHKKSQTSQTQKRKKINQPTKGIKNNAT